MRHFLVEIQALLSHMVCSLVDRPSEATVQLNQAASPMTFEVRVSPDDIGKVIGKHGRTARAIRIIVAASAEQFKHPSVAIDIGPTK